ncbi:MAG TPA: hypothetical protein V6D27_14100 [Vampirovibrionales bacterium]
MNGSEQGDRPLRVDNKWNLGITSDFINHPVCTDRNSILKHLCRLSYQLSPLQAIAIPPFKAGLPAEL